MNDTVSALKAHISLNVKDVSKSVEFYEKLFGIEPLKVRPGYAKFDVQNPPLNLALNEISFKERGALSHLGIQVATTEDVLEIKKIWEQKGLKTKDEMQTDCCYELQDKTWVNDPDGNGWEVFVVLKDNLSEASSCCVTESKNISAKEIETNNKAADCSSTSMETKNAGVSCC